MEKKDKYKAQNKYQAEKCKRYYLRLVKTTDADIIAKLDSVPNKMGYIKELIRKDLQK